MLELGPINVLGVLLGFVGLLLTLVGFFLRDLVTQLKDLTSSMNSLREAVREEAVHRHLLKEDVDCAHQMIRGIQTDLNNLRVDVAGCPRKDAK